MTPHRSNKRGTYLLDRVFPGVGRVRVASGTNHLPTFKGCDGMLTTLYQQGRPDILELIRDGKVKAVMVYGWFRQGELHRIPTGRLLRPLQDRWEAWMDAKEMSPSHRKDLRLTLKGLAGSDTPSVAETALLLAALLERKAGKPRARALAKAHVQSFLKAEVGEDDPLYREVKGIQTGRVTVTRKARPLGVEEVRDVMARMPEGQADVWSRCATGMHTKEYEGEWRVETDRISIGGTKRKGRQRIVPRWTVVTRPSIGSRKLARLVTKASQGTVKLNDFRATFLRWCLEAGISRLNTRFYAGHGAGSMTEHYEMGEIPGQLAADAQRLERYAGDVRAVRLQRA